MSMMVFWVVTHYGFIGGYQRFGGTHRLHLKVETTIDANEFVRFFFGTLKRTNMATERNL
jgi:hypothetical protein